MASFEKSKKGLWSVRFRVIENGALVNKRLSGYELKKNAESAYREFMYSYKPQECSTALDMTFSELYYHYTKYAESRLKASTKVSIESAVEKHILPFFGKRVLKSLTKIDIVNWQNALNQESYLSNKIEKQYSYKYKIKLRGFLHAIFQYGQRYFDLPHNYVSEVETFRNTERKKEMLYWTEEEFLQFIEVVKDILYKTFFSFLYLTGARRGEALALEWTDIDFKNELVHINKQCDFHQPNTAFVIFNMPKNESSIRDIYLSKNLILLLTNLKEQTKGKFVFNDERPLPVESIRRHLQQYCEIAKVKKIRIHDFRHSHASLLINKQQDILVIAQRLGHKNIEQTLNTYAHLFPNKQKELLHSLELDIK